MNKIIKNKMKKILIAILMCMPGIANAQNNTWEMSETEVAGKVINPDQKYLAGAVPVVNGRVVFSTTIEVPGKTANQIHALLLKYMTKMTTEPNQFEQSRITLNDTISNKIYGSYQEWLVFKNKPLVLDRTRLFYNIMVECEDGKAHIDMTRIYYIYDEERQPLTYKAEEWITDEYGLKKKKDKLSRVSGKFRRKTIDRKDYLFNKFADILK